MIPRILLLVALLAPLGGCIAIPDGEIPERLNFNYEPPDHPAMSYDDMLCCIKCEA